MLPERWNAIKDKLHEALQLESTRRAVFLAEIGAADPDLRSELESLIASHEQTGTDFLNTWAPATSVIPPQDGQAEFQGQRVGSYQIAGLIGIGGMGEVYRAFRADDQYKKQVAIKLVRARDDSRLVVQRFKNERQILASLDHPNIARLLDGGSTDEGEPYFVMELIEGLPLNAFCDQHRLPIPERLKLFMQVCSAVQYAHHRLIIHRDIKQSNILVTSEGVPKLLDFGIAKIMDQGSETGPYERTLTVFRVLTPAYASPEQIRGQPLSITSDVYSLGVVLYELLTGRSPYRVSARTPAEFARAACEEEPEKPSSAIRRPPSEEHESAARTAQEVAMARQSFPEKLGKSLSGDLDNIVLMALRKEPEARYVAVEELKRDIDRHLQQLPVKARPSSLAYRASKLFRRRKTEVWSLVATIATAAVSVAVLVSIKNVSQKGSPAPLVLTANLGQTRIGRASISRDGNHLAYADRNGLHVLSIVSGEDRLLRPEPGWSVSDWFPGGTKLLADRRENGHGGVWKISTITGARELLRDHAKDPHVSPDGSTVEFSSELGRELWFMGADGQGANRIAQADSPDSFFSFSWAPDGQHFADIRVRLVGGHREPVLETRTVNSGAPVPLASDSRLSGRDGEIGMVWLKDGSIVSIMRDNPPNQTNDNLWRVSVDERTGQMRGKPERLTDWTGFQMNSLSASLDGRRLAFIEYRNLDSVYIARVGASDGRLSDVRRLTNDNWNNWAAAWSGDSTAIFYKSERHGKWGIFRQDIRQKTPEAVVSGAESYSWFDISPDGHWLLGDVYTPYPKVGQLVRIPTGGGKPELVFSGSSIMHQCASFLSNRCVLAEYDNGEMSLSLLDPIKGRGEHLLTLSLPAVPFLPDYSWSLARDGKHIAVIVIDQSAKYSIQIIDIATRSIRRLPFDGVGWPASVSWAGDSRHIFLSTHTLEDTPSSTLMRMDLQGKAQVLLELSGAFAIYPVPSPDGRFLAFTERIYGNSAAMIERF